MNLWTHDPGHYLLPIILKTKPAKPRVRVYTPGRNPSFYYLVSMIDASLVYHSFIFLNSWCIRFFVFIREFWFAVLTFCFLVAIGFLFVSRRYKWGWRSRSGIGEPCGFTRLALDSGSHSESSATGLSCTISWWMISPPQILHCRILSEPPQPSKSSLLSTPYLSLHLTAVILSLFCFLF